jgi:3-oxoacyl-[acyl-carrier protein] reductase
LQRKYVMRLKGKNAVITGGSKGIGAATAFKFAQEGANVFFTYNSSKTKAEELVKKVSALGVNCKAIQADASNPSAVKDAVNLLGKEIGSIDILVNNAGVFEATGIIGEINEDQFEHQLNVNLRSVFAATQNSIKFMKSGGRIITIGSCLGERGIFPGVSAYNMTKFAVIGFAKSWAHDLAAKNITSNAVLPGPIATDMLSPGAENMSVFKRAGRPEEVANMIAFLASEEASYVTGASIAVDGGVNA